MTEGLLILRDKNSLPSKSLPSNVYPTVVFFFLKEYIFFLRVHGIFLFAGRKFEQETVMLKRFISNV
ncbi:hypothetical protein P5673_011293 [Acropora cervicornis]|uniref:Uncharacterized protein n=1 Tax=Acropora cervicornis TaxID=6130 RepID=A0AAD9QQ22_ACRCE|nr:hypothetical protein P5673_011293 [Acropora cervicornis]